MSSPWLSIPLADYEGHMTSPDVQQLGALADLFAEALQVCPPATLAILGVAGGNGLDRIDTAVTKRIVGVDVNPLYLAEVKQRFPHLAQLELHCVDLANQRIAVDPVGFVHVALLFEHAGVDLCLQNAVSLVAAEGALSVVLQLPSESAQGVSLSPFASLQTLKSHFTLIDPVWLRESLAASNLYLSHETRCTLPAGKGFWLGVFHRKS